MGNVFRRAYYGDGIHTGGYRHCAGITGKQDVGTGHAIPKCGSEAKEGLGMTRISVQEAREMGHPLVMALDKAADDVERKRWVWETALAVNGEHPYKDYILAVRAGDPSAFLRYEDACAAVWGYRDAYDNARTHLEDMWEHLCNLWVLPQQGEDSLSGDGTQGEELFGWMMRN